MNSRVYNVLLRKVAADDNSKAKLFTDRIEDDEVTVDEDQIGSAETGVEDSSGANHDSKGTGFYDGRTLDKWNTPEGMLHNLKVTAKKGLKKGKEYTQKGIDEAKKGAKKGVDETKKTLNKADKAMGGRLGGAVGAAGGGLLGALIAAKLSNKASIGKRILAILAGLGLGGAGGYMAGNAISAGSKKKKEQA